MLLDIKTNTKLHGICFGFSKVEGSYEVLACLLVLNLGVHLFQN